MEQNVANIEFEQGPSRYDPDYVNHSAAKSGQFNIWVNKLMNRIHGDPKSATAWKFWNASHPINMGDALRFRVRGSKHEGYVTLRYKSQHKPEPGDDSPQKGTFDIEFGALDGTQYRTIKTLDGMCGAGVHWDDLVKTISLNVL